MAYEEFEVPKNYESLSDVLSLAIQQAATGKGKERHATGEPFDKQPICNISRQVGVGFALGQAMKKIQESTRMDKVAGTFELLGAINYIAAAIIVRGEE
jgi:hypothetical protein